MKKQIQLTLLLTAFLCITQIAQGQKYSGTIQNIGKTCIPNSLLDSMIHDVMVGKVLKAKDSISRGYIYQLERQNAVINTEYQASKISLLKSENKRSRNGWQRNVFIGITIALSIFAFR